MIEIKATRIDMYMVELLGQIHMMSEADYIKFLENLDELPRPEAMNQEPEVENLFTGIWRALTKPKAEPVEEWEPETTVDESEANVNEAEIRTEGMPEEALDPEKAEPEEVQPVAANEPEAQGDSNTEAVEAEDLLKEKGMVEKPEYQGKEPAILEPTPEPEEKPKKFARKWEPSDFEKYIAMAKDGARPKDIMKAMTEGLGVKLPNAQQLFYAKVGPFAPLERDAIPEPAPKAVEPIEPRSIVESVKLVPAKPVQASAFTKEVKAPKPLRDVAREHGVPMDVVSEIAQMPPYDSARTFKDTVCIRESMNTNYKIETLKAVYRDTHRNVRW